MRVLCIFALHTPMSRVLVTFRLASPGPGLGLPVLARACDPDAPASGFGRRASIDSPAPRARYQSGHNEYRQLYQTEGRVRQLSIFIMSPFPDRADPEIVPSRSPQTTTAPAWLAFGGHRTLMRFRGGFNCECDPTSKGSELQFSLGTRWAGVRRRVVRAGARRTRRLFPLEAPLDLTLPDRDVVES